MASDIRQTNALALAQAQAIADGVDSGTLGSPKLRIYDGTRPATAEEAITSQTLLAEIDLPVPAFTVADAAPGAALNLNGLPLSDAAAAAGGTATWFRVSNRDNVTQFDGFAGDAADDPDLRLNNKVIQQNVQVTIDSGGFVVPE